MVTQPEEPRPDAIDVPPNRVAAASELVDELDRVRAGSDALMAGVEETTGLRAGEVHALEAVADGADHVRAVARHTGQPTRASLATAEGLVTRGFLGRHHHGAAPRTSAPGMLHVTETGHALLTQIRALRIRVTDAILASLDGSTIEQLRATVRAYAAALPLEPRLQLTS